MRFRFHRVLVAAIVLIAAVLLVRLAIQETEQQNSENIDLNTLTMPVVGIKVTRQTIADNMNLAGTLRARDAVEIKSKVDGTIAKVAFTSGQKVVKGETLVLFNQEKAKAALIEAELTLSLAQVTLNRYQELLKDGGVSRLEFDQAANQVKMNQAVVGEARAAFDSTVVSAPFAGVMGQRLVNDGQFISQGDSLGFLVNQDSMKVDFRVPERYISQIKNGAPVDFKVDAYPRDRFQGTIVFIDPTVDESTRTILITAEVSNPDGRLRQGMFAEISLTLHERPDAIVVPEDAVVFKGNKTVVYTVRGNQTVAVTPVDCGLHVNGVVEILKGLQEGQTVITEGFQKVHAGSKVRVRLQDQ
ncbi:MAG: efflux RND transporter periplasmic adaptor subunit [Candidatus Omnitrophica bacterium]|nr:efflux RND transporter periplasmic adaptor subunit [Candidatus Omnitrophota bacterium]MDE2009235.1 efflux RND transporter periplasmic adaptor subunit [Candidatus Omnitrophota bacterium]MDE2213755.1 efflux RND transporter periplasmic adaptor subunit [Candidatus Omnitrophota bacterium]MDE2230669.1 efflux RND transporter periplasmic adaptor subunit [Candidatus Omnitrophota bacterium]